MGEKFLNDLRECELEELVKHGLRALRDTLPNEVDLTNKNVSIAIVGKDHPFTVYDDAGVDPYLASIEGEERRGQRAAGEGEGEGAADGEGGEAPSTGHGHGLSGHHILWRNRLRWPCHYFVLRCISRREGVKDLCDLAPRNPANILTC